MSKPADDLYHCKGNTVWTHLVVLFYKTESPWEPHLNKQTKINKLKSEFSVHHTPQRDYLFGMLLLYIWFLFVSKWNFKSLELCHVILIPSMCAGSENELMWLSHRKSPTCSQRARLYKDCFLMFVPTEQLSQKRMQF